MGFSVLQHRSDRLQLNVPMKGEQRDMLIAHHEALVAAGLGGTITDTARQLILEALATHHDGVLVSATARRAYQRVYGWVLQRTKAFFDEMSKEVDSQITLMESQPCSCCGRPMSEHDSNHR
jgi:hypothetical protein